jgi:hypothetical protein
MPPQVAEQYPAADPTAAIGAARPDTRTPREIRYANQVHRATSRGMMAAVLGVVVALLAVIPGYLLLANDSGSRNFATIESLHVPSWATLTPVDHATGNHWCLSSCLKSDRTMTSTHSVDETATAYDTALRAAGWTPAPRNACPPATKGVAQSCWVLDRRQMNVLVTTSACAAPAPPTSEPSITEPLVPPSAPAKSSGCAPTTVTVSLFDRIDLRLGKS